MSNSRVFDPVSVDKFYRNKINNIQISIYNEIKYLLSLQFNNSLVDSNCVLDFRDGNKIVIIKSTDFFNFLSKLGIYPISTESKTFFISNSSIKTDTASLTKRTELIKSKLLSDLNNNSDFKIEKIQHNKMSDEEISKIKRDNNTKSDLHKKLIESIKSLKLSLSI